jgi:hypothetical protein
MTEQDSNQDSRVKAVKAEAAAIDDQAHQAKVQANNDATVSGAHDPSAVKGLTPEQQMALYEEKLKEDDWGHQPC